MNNIFLNPVLPSNSFLPQGFRSDTDGLREDGACQGNHDQEEAANSKYLERSVEDRPGLEPWLLLHPLHDDRKTEHSWSSHGYSGDHNLEKDIVVESKRMLS
jgi:hypothetical protein